MLYKPSHMIPYYTDIDGSVDNTFSCVINAVGSTSISKYTFIINDLSGNQQYESTVVPTQNYYSDDVLQITLPADSIINGYDYVWKIKLYEDNPTIYVTNGAVTNSGISTTTQIYVKVQYLITVGHYIQIGTEIRKITAYDNTTGQITVDSAFSTAPSVGTLYTILSDYITSDDTYFKARTTPTIIIDSFPQIIERKDYTFTATYRQEQGLNYKYFQWILYDEGNNVVQKSEEIYQGVIKYTFDGLISDRLYKIKVLLVTQDDSICESEMINFIVRYETFEISSETSVNLLSDKTAVEIKWNNLYNTTGEAYNEETHQVITDDLDYINISPTRHTNIVELNQNENISFEIQQFDNLLTIPYESSICFYLALFQETTMFDNYTFSDVYTQSGYERIYVDFINSKYNTSFTNVNDANTYLHDLANGDDNAYSDLSREIFENILSLMSVGSDKGFFGNEVTDVLALHVPSESREGFVEDFGEPDANQTYGGEIIRLETTRGIELTYMTNAFPLHCSKDDKFYNTSDNLLYTAIADDTWGAGTIPVDNIFYSYGDYKYVYNGTQLEEYIGDLPYYKVSFTTWDWHQSETDPSQGYWENMSKGKFHYEIHNVDHNYSGDVRVDKSFWYKLVLLPDRLVVVPMTEMPNVFRGNNSTINPVLVSKLFANNHAMFEQVDYNLITTDKLYK